MIELVGKHGTSTTNAESIKKNGFTPFPGRRGKGIYFWKDGPFAEALAHESYSFNFKKRSFSGQRNPNCTIITAKLYTEEDGLFDLTKDYNFEAFVSYIKTINLTAPTEREERKKFYAQKIDEFIVEIEARAGLKVKVICVSRPSARLCSKK